MPKSVIIESDQSKAFTPPADDFLDFLTEMKGKVSQETNTRQIAFERARRNYDMYRGMIGRPNADLPYEGSADIRYRLACMYLRQTRSGFTNAVLIAPKITRYTAVNSADNDAADRVEGYNEDLYRRGIKDFHNIVDYCFSHLGIYGRTVVKVTWCHEFELSTESRPRQPFVDKILGAQALKYQKMAAGWRQQKIVPGEKEFKQADLSDEEIEQVVAGYLGWNPDNTDRYDERISSVMKQLNGSDDEIEVVVDKVVRNDPHLSVINYEDLICPDDTKRLDTAEWIVHKLRFSKRALESKSNKNGGPYKNVEKVLEDYKGAPEDVEQRRMESAKRKSEGLAVQRDKKNLFNVCELYCWVKRSWIKRFNNLTDTTPDFMVRAVITYCPEVQPGQPPEVLRAIELPYNHKQWPFVDFYYNQTEERFYENEGIVGLLWPLELEHNMSRNAAINRTTWAMSPPGVCMEECGFQSNTHRQLGQIHPVDDQAFIASGGQPVSFLKLPDLTGLPNYDAQQAKAWASEFIGVPNVAALGNYATAPTAEQVNQVVTPAQMIQQHEIFNWLERWGRVFWMVHELCKQYLFLDGRKEIGYTNRDTKEGARVSQADFDKEYIIMSGGDPQMGPQVLLDQKRVFTLQAYIQNPALAPFGDLYEAWRSTVSHLLPFNEAQAFIPDRSKANQVNQAFMQMQAQAAAKLAAGKRPPRQQKKTALQNAASGLQPR
jgi:hypothetical protein